ncbi:MAG: hypothetical protein KAY32_11210 [Candidatus Eisenbacteria sp.]|nr:hypothetical protein [Candidatus Eisenbacteria bacterium]
MTEEAATRTPGEQLVWGVHPAGERKWFAAGITLMILGLSVLTALWMRTAYWGIFAGIVLFLSLEGFYLPSRFRLGADGVEVRKPFSRVTREWTHFRSVWFDGIGVTLSPFGRRHWLEPYRGVRLRYGVGPQAPAPAEVRRFLLAHLDAERVHIGGLSAEERAVATVVTTERS